LNNIKNNWESKMYIEAVLKPHSYHIFNKVIAQNDSPML
jgi:hypothetical protein